MRHMATAGLVLFAVLGATASCTFKVRLSDEVKYVRADTPEGQDTGVSGDADVGADSHAADTFEVLPDAQLEDLVSDLEQDSTQPDCVGNTDCDDSLDCTYDECNNGVCVNKPEDVLCTGDNPCLKDSCVPGTGCVHEPTPGEHCDLGSKCVLDSRCDDLGECKATTEKICAPDFCYDSWCNAQTGDCEVEYFDGKNCNDDDECTDHDACNQGVCVGVYVAGLCPCGGNEDCKPFENDNLCDGTLVCDNGECVVDPETVVTCPITPEGGCSTIECEPMSGQCVINLFPAEHACTDFNPCTVGDTCDGNGNCVTESAPEGSDCDLDGNLCSQDKCFGGDCQYLIDVNCVPENPCLEGNCNPDTGGCTFVELSGVGCSDGNPCTTTDLCIEGECVSGPNICVDCQDPTNAGGPCSDGVGVTIGDFCLDQECQGFYTHYSDSGGDGDSGLQAISSFGEKFSALGLKKASETSSTTPVFVEIAPSGMFLGQTGYSSAALDDLDGKVAVGNPDSVYLKTGAWIANNGLRTALSTACPKMGSGNPPTAIAYRDVPENNSIPSELKTIQVAMVGFEASGSDPDHCFVARCHKAKSSGWTCSTMGMSSLVKDEIQATSAYVTAVWTPPGGYDCLGTPTGCIGSSEPSYIATVTDSAAGQKIQIYKGTTLSVNQSGQWKTVFSASAAVDHPIPKVIRELRLASGGDFYAVGTHGLLVAVSPDGQVTTPSFPEIQELGMPHYMGVYAHGETVLLLAIIEEHVPEGGDVMVLRSGFVMAQVGNVFGATTTSGPWFNELFSLDMCPGCFYSPVGPWGTMDLAVNLDHLDPTLDILYSGPTIMVAGTLPDPDTGKAAATVAVLKP